MPSTKRWAERKRFIYRMRSESLCWLRRQQDETPATAATLGLFKPARIKRLLIQPEDDPAWTVDQLAKLKQAEQEEMFGTSVSLPELEKIPFKFTYEFDCTDPLCNGHSLLCTDWEMGETYRRFRDLYGQDGWEQKFRVNFERNMMDKKETHFYVGTVHQWPKSWIIVGLFYPPL